MGVTMKIEEGYFVVVVIVIFMLGAVFGISIIEMRHDNRISICDVNNFTYQKCGELYGWDLK